MLRALKYQQFCIFGLNNFTGMEKIHFLSLFSLLPEGGHGGIYQRGVETVKELRPVELNTNCSLLPGYQNPGVAGQSDLIQAVAQLVLQYLHCDTAEHFQGTDWASRLPTVSVSLNASFLAALLLRPR